VITYLRERFHPLWRLRQQAWYRRLQGKLDFAVPARRGRIKFYVMFLRDFAVLAPHQGAEAVSRGMFGRMIKELGATHFFDIGANVGTYAWSARELLPEIEVFLFEPDPVNVKLLKRTIARNALAGVQLWEGVVAGQSGTRTFLVDEASGTVGSLRDDAAKNPLQAAYRMARRIRVAATTLDDYMEKVRGERPEVVIKIDVEGAEAEVLEGGRRFFEKLRPLMIVECFERENLRPMRGLEYAMIDLREGSNVLLVPRERLEELRAKRIAPEGEAAQALE
jgi:FkbM family methyltransferase